MSNVYKITVNGKQYSRLEKMLNIGRKALLAENRVIRGKEFFGDIIEEICLPMRYGECTYDELMESRKEDVELLRVLTREIYPDDEDYFVRQMGKVFHCPRDISIMIELKF
ncbi:MAG: hypothetical protein NC121_18525 [Blautia sp.]|nr:hypothetical protein [Blautia sp.]